MPRQPKLTDLQLVLLSHAVASDSRSVMPLPDSVTDRTRADREFKALLKRGMLAEAETTHADQSWRGDGDLLFALTITDAGLAAIALGEVAEAGGGGSTSEVSDTASAPPATPRTTSKIAYVVKLLKRGEGATLAELVAATDWQPHTTRAALTGLRKKGHVISKAERDGVPCYRITGFA